MSNSILATLNKKTKITLSDYPYKRDIENRIFLSDLSLLEVSVLQEILNSSIKIPLSELSSQLDLEIDQLQPIIDKLSTTGLLCRQKDSIFVDKELRKYFEFYIQEFEEDFEPNVDFLLGILNKVPISVLPTWYNISKTSDNIYASLIEKFLQTPKIYEKHLNEISFPDPLFQSIIRDVFESKDLMVPTEELRKIHNLSKEKFEELMLQLEFHLVLCVRYRKHQNKWQAVVTPFHEWHDYLEFLEKTKPKTIAKIDTITQEYPGEPFGLLLEIQQLLKQAHSGKSKKNQTFSPLAIQYAEMMNFVELVEGKIVARENPESFLEMSLQDQSMYLYRHAFSEVIRTNEYHIENPERSFREVEKSLRRVLHSGWILLEDFLSGFISQVGKEDPISLKRVGKKWRYAVPQYSSAEKKFIETIILGPLAAAGLVAKGTYEGKPCFMVSSFGKVAFGE